MEKLKVLLQRMMRPVRTPCLNQCPCVLDLFTSLNLSDRAMVLKMMVALMDSAIQGSFDSSWPASRGSSGGRLRRRRVELGVMDQQFPRLRRPCRLSPSSSPSPLCPARLGGDGGRRRGGRRGRGRLLGRRRGPGEDLLDGGGGAVGSWLCHWPVTRAGAGGEVVWRRLRGAVRVGGQRSQDRAGGGAQCRWAPRELDAWMGMHGDRMAGFCSGPWWGFSATASPCETLRGAVVGTAATHPVASPGEPRRGVHQGTSRIDCVFMLRIGVAAGHLCAAVRAGGGGVELHGLGPGPTWKMLHGICGLAVDGVDLRPLRFESDNYDVLMRIGERVVALDIVEGTAREARLDSAVLPEEDRKIVPWCRAASTLLL